MNLSQKCAVCNGGVKVDKSLDRKLREDALTHSKGNVQLNMRRIYCHFKPFNYRPEKMPKDGKRCPPESLPIH